jgi:hypothetical protein
MTEDSLAQFPLAKYAAKCWFKHAYFDGMQQNTEEGMKQLFDWIKPYLSIWLWIHDPTMPTLYSWQQCKRDEAPFPPCGTPLHYVAFCGLHNFAKIMATEYPKDVNSQSFDDALMPLHLTLRQRHIDMAQMLVECGTNVSS